MADWIDSIAQAIEAEAAITVHAAQAQQHLEVALAESTAIGLAKGLRNYEDKEIAGPLISADPEEAYGRGARIHLRPSGRGGIGVFAGEPIKANHVVERCPLLLFAGKPSEAADYYITVDDDLYPNALALGFGSIYNHCPAPNTSWTASRTAMTIVSIADIAEGEEILINYGPKWFVSRDKQEISDVDAEP